jgi:hypothetical protein
MRNMLHETAQRPHGFISLEVMATLVVLVAGMAIGMQWIGRDFEQRANQIAAQHALLFADAAGNYIKANYSTVKAAASPLATYTAANISAYLPSSLTTTNNYGQSYSVRVYNNGSILQTMVVTTGGDTISEGSIRSIASLIGAHGGYVSSLNTAVAQGTQGGWSMGFDLFGSTPGSGKVAVALFFADGQQVSDYLYRNVVAGHPELNRMGTTLDMGSNAIANASTVAAGQIGTNGLSPSSGYPAGWSGGIHTWDIFAEGTIGAGSTSTARAYLTSAGNVGASGSVSATGNLNTSSNVNASGTVTAGAVQSSTEVTAQNWLRTNGNSGWYSNAWGGGWYMQDSTWVRSYADKSVYTGGTMMAGSMRSLGRLQADEYVHLAGSAAAGGSCSPNGLLAQDGTGGLLSCQSGVWTRASGAKTTFTATNFSVSVGSGITSTFTPSSYASGTPMFVFGSSSSAGYGNCEGSVQVQQRSAGGAVLMSFRKFAGFNIGNGADGGSGMVAQSAFMVPMVEGAYYLDFRGFGCWGGTVYVYAVGMTS